MKNWLLSYAGAVPRIFSARRTGGADCGCRANGCGLGAAQAWAECFWERCARKEQVGAEAIVDNVV